MTLNAQQVECQVNDPCRQCTHYVPHAPLLAAYDEELGDYTLATERFCMARWASGNLNHAAGSICGGPVARKVGDVDLCQHHFERAEKWLRWGRDVEDRREAAKALREAAKDYQKAVAESAAFHEKVDAQFSVVYFVRRVSDGMIKIGTTRSFEERVKSLRADHGELQVLLTVSGNRALEAEMHRKFDMYRRPRTELFAPANVLLVWIYRQRTHPTYRGSQLEDAVKASAIRKLADAAPLDEELQWKYGRAVWPPQEIAA